MGSMVDFVNSITHGAGATPVSVPITVTPPGDPAISTVGNWVDSRIFEVPEGAGFHRREGSHFLEVTLAAVPSAPRDTVVVAPEVAGGPNKNWSVESSERFAALGKRILILVEA